jgi:hypothetical protein
MLLTAMAVVLRDPDVPCGDAVLVGLDLKIFG